MEVSVFERVEQKEEEEDAEMSHPKAQQPSSAADSYFVEVPMASPSPANSFIAESTIDMSSLSTFSSLSLFHIFQLTPSGLKRIHSFPTTFVYSNYFLPNSPFCFFFSSSNQLFFLKICQRNVRKAMNIKRYFFYLSLSFSLTHTHTYTCIDESTHTFPHTCIQHTHMTHPIFRHHWY